jgi:hypothetical protein
MAAQSFTTHSTHLAYKRADACPVIVGKCIRSLNFDTPQTCLAPVRSNSDVTCIGSFCLEPSAGCVIELSQIMCLWC